MKLAQRFPSQDLVVKTGVAGTGVLAYHTRHVRPPVALQDQLQSLPPPRMSCDQGVMVLCNNPSPKVCFVWNIDATIEQE